MSGLKPFKPLCVRFIIKRMLVQQVELQLEATIFYFHLGMENESSGEGKHN